MPTTIAVTCTWCSTSNSVPAAAMLATVDADGLDLRFAGSVCWICCGCLNVVTEPVAWRPFLTLLSVGVPLLVDDAAEDGVDTFDGCGHRAAPNAAPAAGARPTHPEHPPVGPAFTADDQLDLHELLTGEAWLLQLVASTGVTEPQP
jgi:hypothetical protein